MKKSILMAWLLLAAPLVALPAFSSQVYIQECLTQNDYDDQNPRINDLGHIVWEAHDGNDWEVFLFDGTEVINIMDDTVDDRNPDLNNTGQVVWEKASIYGTDIWRYDWNEKVDARLSHYLRDYSDPRVNDSDVAVWLGFDGNDDEVYRSVDFGIEEALTDDQTDDYRPKINNNGLVVWEGNMKFEGPDIYLYDGASVSTLTTRGLSPQINDSDQVVWSESVDDYWGSEIFLYEAGTAVPISLTLGHDEKPRIADNGHVTWMADMVEGGLPHYLQIYLYDGTETKRISEGTHNCWYPQIGGNGHVAWHGIDYPDFELFVWDGAQVHRLTDDLMGDDEDPRINADGVVVWESWDGSDHEIWRAWPCDDADGDGYAAESCGGPDCNDDNPEVYPGAPEICDGLDSDCDGFLVGEIDLDQDGWRACAGDCDEEDPDIHPGAPEVCDGVDQDCDGSVDEDSDWDWYDACEDCDNDDFYVHPGAPELCDGKDSDCDGVIPAEELDMDGDHYVPCSPWLGDDPAIWGGGDCDDSDPDVYAQQEEVCNDGMDNDCDGEVDFDYDTECDVVVGWLHSDESVVKLGDSVVRTYVDVLPVATTSTQIQLGYDMPGQPHWQIVVDQFRRFGTTVEKLHLTVSGDVAQAGPPYEFELCFTDPNNGKICWYPGKRGDLSEAFGKYGAGEGRTVFFSGVDGAVLHLAALDQPLDSGDWALVEAGEVIELGNTATDPLPPPGGCADADYDGFSPDGGGCGPVDCDDEDRSVNPGAPDPCDGLDQDCDGTDGSLEGAAFGNCADGADNDCDGLIDTDPECTPACAARIVPVSRGPAAFYLVPVLGIVLLGGRALRKKD